MIALSNDSCGNSFIGLSHDRWDGRRSSILRPTFQRLPLNRWDQPTTPDAPPSRQTSATGEPPAPSHLRSRWRTCPETTPDVPVVHEIERRLDGGYHREPIDRTDGCRWEPGGRPRADSGGQ